MRSDIVIRIRTILRKPIVKIVLGIVLVLMVFFAVYLFNKYNKYSDYEVVKSIKIDSGNDSKYEPYKDFVVKYSGDGISYIDGDETVWEEGYEMKVPIIDICDDYIAVADKIFLFMTRMESRGR